MSEALVQLPHRETLNLPLISAFSDGRARHYIDMSSHRMIERQRLTGPTS